MFCSATSGSSNEPDSNMAMSQSDLETCQWLRPSKKASSPGVSGDADHRAASPLSPSPSASYDDCCFSTVGSAAQPSSGSVSSLHSSASKHSSVLLNALPSPLLNYTPPWTERVENFVERAIFNFRFLSLLAVAGSLAGSFLCFLKGCVFITESYGAFYTMCLKGVHNGKVILRLVEAVDVYLTGTVMLIFGMGLYGLFVSNVASGLPPKEDRALQNSSLFGMFLLQKRPKWMRIASLDELKTKLGHVVVMILLVKMFERSKAITVTTSADLLSYSISIFLTSGALLVLRHLHN